MLPDFRLGLVNLKNAKNLSEELTPIVWHAKRYGNFACQKLRKKKKK